MSTRGPYAVGQRRREEILDAATRAIEQKGYYKTSMLEIAEAVGISEGGLMHHFPSKRHLLLAVSQRQIEANAARWDALPEDVEGFRVFDLMVEMTARGSEHPGLIELVVIMTAEAVDQSSPAHGLFRTRNETAVADLASRLRRGLDRDGYTNVDCDDVARSCIAFNDGILLQWVISGGAFDLTLAVRHHVDRLVESIRGPASVREL